MKKKKGFTLAELLIVVAVLAVLVAIAIPTFSDIMEKAKEGKDLSTLRSAYTDIMLIATQDGPVKLPFFYDKSTNSIKVFVKCESTKDKWQTNSNSTTIAIGGVSVGAPTTEKPYFRIKYNKTTGECEFTRYAASKYGSGEFTANHLYN